MGTWNSASMSVSRVTQDNVDLKALVADFPALVKEHSEQINQRLAQIANPGYFFLSNSWQTALSTGALEHMLTEEVSAYGGAANAIRIYSGLQMDAEKEEAETKSFFESHPLLAPDQAQDGLEHLLRFSHAENSLAFAAPQLKDDLVEIVAGRVGAVGTAGGGLVEKKVGRGMRWMRLCWYLNRIKIASG